MDGPLPKSEEGAEELGNSVRGASEGGGDSTVQGYLLQGSGTGGPNLREWDMGHNGIHDEGYGRVPSLHLSYYLREDDTAS